jgi:hypothetical protein
MLDEGVEAADKTRFVLFWRGCVAARVATTSRSKKTEQATRTPKRAGFFSGRNLAGWRVVVRERRSEE